MATNIGASWGGSGGSWSFSHDTSHDVTSQGCHIQNVTPSHFLSSLALSLYNGLFGFSSASSSLIMSPSLLLIVFRKLLYFVLWKCLTQNPFFFF
jgi:hypothetical protein